MMRVMSISTIGDPEKGGGAERIMNMLMEAFADAGHEASILATDAQPGIQTFKRGGVTHWRVGLRNVYWPRLNQRQNWVKRRLWHLIDVFNPFMRKPLRKILEIAKPDVILLHNITGWSIAILETIKSARIPMIQILHDHYYICANSAMFKNGRNCETPCRECRILRYVHRHVSNKLNAVVGVSRYILDRHEANGIFDHVGFRRVIHNGVSFDASTAVQTQEDIRDFTTARGPDIIYFGFIGALVPAKGVDYLLKSFTQWDNQAARLLIAGAGDDSYVAHLQSRYTDDRVSFLGRVDPTDFFKQIDVTVVPSLWQENYPGVVCESILFGVPVIASRRGGIPEIIEDGISGLFFEPNKPESLSTLFALIMSNPEKLRNLRFGVMTAKNVNSDIGAWYRSYLSLIEEIRTNKEEV
jgi:glycosyltransferase involved in cell wall biosynthesis